MQEIGNRDREFKKKSIMEKSKREFDRDLLAKSFVYMLHSLPNEYQSEDSHRILLAYFAISGLDILNSLELINTEHVINWVYSLQVLPRSDDEEDDSAFYGFQGSSTVCFPWHDKAKSSIGGHLASTYCALCILKIVGDDFSQVDCKRILRTMKRLQQNDGSFTYIHTGAEKDLRFVYCAAAICYMLSDWSGMDLEKSLDFIRNCQSYDGGFGLVPGGESHGGASYCAVASLKLMGYITEDPDSKRVTCSVVDCSSLLDWAIQKQAPNGGFQGRANKESDSCYSFWVGGLLKMWNCQHYFDWGALRTFLLTCQSKIGGFSKWPNGTPDLFHTYYGLCGLCLVEEHGLNPLCWELGITERANNLPSCGACP